MTGSARLFATYMPAGIRRVSTRFEILKERKMEEEREEMRIMLKKFIQKLKKCEI